MLPKRKTLIVLSLIVLIGVGVVLYQLAARTTFGNVLDETIPSQEDITHITVEAYSEELGETLWATIDDVEIIDHLLTEHKEIALKKQRTKHTKILDYMMTISTPTKSDSFHFDETHFVASGTDYKMLNGHLVDSIDRLDVEWQTTDEFLGIE